MPHQDRLNIAVFIDFDNIEIGVRTTLGEHFDIGTILEALKERGEVITKIAYADWTRAGEYSRALTQHAIRLVQRNLTPGGDKNGADINLALDALEMAFTHPHINSYVIVGGDSDFLSLVEKLKQYDKKVFVVGGRAFTSVILQRNCHEFIAYENLIRKPVPKGGRPVTASATAPVSQAFPIVRRALKNLADREVTPQTGLLKSTLLQLDSTFSERNYGASSFLDFAEKLAQAGLVQLKHAGRSVMVELNAGFDDGESSQPSADFKLRTAPQANGAPSEQEHAAPDGQESSSVPGASTGAPPSQTQPAPEPVVQAGSGPEGVRLAADILGAAANARWPMYLRNVKQVFRAAAFDERRYGFGGLMDLLRACGREGYVRLERDRRGGLRAFLGPALSRGSQPHAAAALPPELPELAEPAEIAAAEPIEPAAPEAEADVVDGVPMAVVDTTAELLGRARPKRPHSRTAASNQRAATGRKPAAKKATVRTKARRSAAPGE